MPGRILRYNNAYNYLNARGMLPQAFNQEVGFTGPDSNGNEEFLRPYPQLGASAEDAIQSLERLVNQHMGTTRATAVRNLPAQSLAPEELAREAQRILEQDRVRLGRSNYPVYRGTTTAPMSTLTQRSRELRDRFSGRPLPYSGRIERVLNRNNEGLSQQNVQDLLNNLRQNQQSFSQNSILNMLGRHFQNSYNPNTTRLTQRTERDINRFLPEVEQNLQNTRQASNSLEANRNRQITGALQGLQRNNLGRREALISNLEQFGNQRHAYNNMVNSASRRQFEQEAAAPWGRMARLENALAASGGGTQEHPDISRAQGHNIIQALRAYGIDPSRPVSEWNSSRTEPSRYTGQLVANLPPEIQASGEVLERLSPNLQNNYTDRRRELTRSLVNTPNLSATALEGIPAVIQGQVGQLETDARRRLRRDLASINNEYIRLGQYSSPQHISAAEDRAREINRATFEGRNQVLQNSLRDQLQQRYANENNNIRQLSTIGEQTHNEFGNLLRDLQNMNQRGARRFSNEQAENDESYRNYQNEALWQWPHLRNNIMTQGQQTGRQGALGEIFRGLADRNISLDNLANLNTNHSELQRENRQLIDQLRTFQQARDPIQRSEREAAERQQRAQAEGSRLRSLQLERAQRNYEEMQRELNALHGQVFRTSEAHAYSRATDPTYHARHASNVSRYNQLSSQLSQYRTQ